VIYIPDIVVEAAEGGFGWDVKTYRGGAEWEIKRGSFIANARLYRYNAKLICNTSKKAPLSWVSN
jgi:hypothetical protein